jgi:hypothetical protein
MSLVGIDCRTVVRTPEQSRYAGTDSAAGAAVNLIYLNSTIYSRARFRLM